MHYYKRNLGDYAKKAGRLSMLQHGSYTLLLDACYDREQFPTEEEAIEWTWASTSEEVEAVKFVLRKFFVLEDGRYVQKRVQEELSEYHEKAAINARIAKERETKRKESSTNRARVVNEPSPKVDEPPPNHKPLTINQEPNNKTRKALAVRPDDVSQAVWDDFTRLRKEKRAPLTATALAGIAVEAKKAGLTLEKALERCCRQGWQGFDATWVPKVVRPAGRDPTDPDGLMRLAV